MPLWQFFHPPSAFKTAEEKQAVVKDVTNLYTSWGLPAFYVVVQFFPLTVDANNANAFVGGEPATNFVRIIVHHLAFQSMGNLAAHKRISSNIDTILKPHVADKGLDWEYHVAESPPTMWKINGLVPPVMGNPAVKIWAADNRPSPYDEDAVGKELEGK
ncbi:hypothetical protein F503_04535 [Ophiostoma piceae UAMH 11346]|uniref:Tautomerase cis-CaaD-like domain-containing protein n=1 Tax=Ophiostoma piceae (strain UAMH 11346) TaxID=1262450 RepID=S3CQS5_OPHP1|nr:hypothetical protein F503_04535 [Ophiostoma piceae UAMH 11346]